MNRKIIMGILPLLIALIVMSAFTVVYNVETDEIEKGEVNYNLSYRFVVVNEGKLNLSQLTIRLALLKNWEPVQSVTNITIHTLPNATTTDEYDNRFAWYDYDTFSSGQILDLRFDVNLTLNLLDYTRLSIDTGDYDKNSEEYKLYMAYDSLTDATDLRVQHVASELPGTRYIDQAYEAYNFTTSHLRYKLLSESRGAGYALDQGYGDCDEFQNLFIALSRSMGIPAIGHTAWFADFETGFETVDAGAASHAYPMFYLPEYGLLPVDPTRGDTNFYDSWLKTDEKVITLTRGPDHPYRLMNYRWVPVEGIPEPSIKSNYTITIHNQEIVYFSQIRAMVLVSFTFIPILFVSLNIIMAKKIRANRKIKLEKLLEPTIKANENELD